jgi:hypothetical protein
MDMLLKKDVGFQEMDTESKLTILPGCYDNAW